MAPILLLAVYLPMVVLSSLHLHHDTVDKRDVCVGCVGHFEVQHEHQADCLYCHFLAERCLCPSEARDVPCVSVARDEVWPPQWRLPHNRCGALCLRGPPMEQ